MMGRLQSHGGRLLAKELVHPQQPVRDAPVGVDSPFRFPRRSRGIDYVNRFAWIYLNIRIWSRGLCGLGIDQEGRLAQRPFLRRALLVEEDNIAVQIIQNPSKSL